MTWEKDVAHFRALEQALSRGQHVATDDSGGITVYGLSLEKIGALSQFFVEKSGKNPWELDALSIRRSKALA